MACDRADPSAPRVLAGRPSFFLLDASLWLGGSTWVDPRIVAERRAGPRGPARRPASATGRHARFGGLVASPVCGCPSDVFHGASSGGAVMGHGNARSPDSAGG